MLTAARAARHSHSRVKHMIEDNAETVWRLRTRLAHHEVSNDGQCPNAHAAKGCGGGDVAVQLLLQALHSVPVALQVQWSARHGYGGCEAHSISMLRLA